jgi:hypothetical protein
LTARSSHKCLRVSALSLAASVSLACWGQELPPNPLARGGGVSATSLAGVWYGADLEMRTHCTNVQNNGWHGTYAQYTYSLDPSIHRLSISQAAVNGLSCTYEGDYSDGTSFSWSGTLSCSDGKRATFQTRSALITPNEISLRLDMKLNGAESCDVDAILGGSRF